MAESSSSPGATEEITAGIGNIVVAALGVGAALAHTAARVTSVGMPVPEPPVPQTPVGDLVHYSVQTVGNLVSLMTSTVGGIIQLRPDPPTGDPPTAAEPPVPAPAPKPAAPASPAPQIPVVRAGSTLRLPLMIENPGAEPMAEMVFICMEVRGIAHGVGPRVSAESIRFLPTSLNVAPRDFEKLTVFIDTIQATAPGRYEVLISTTSKAFEMTLRFEVLPGAKSPTLNL
ncbi:MAG: hypothetical protein SH847_12970 [Roseiflexaceae bacterium]|nr:hypothetical protein [Roseiflexaceae bacterium]